jgi:putative FmdB family regulatory protein
MPIYEYACKSCKKTFEYMQSISEAAKSVCEECGGELSRLISAAAFHLKGGGWYKDLYSSSKPSAGGGDTASSEAKSSEAKSSEAKSSDAGSKTSSSSGSGAGSGGDAKAAKSSGSKGND